MVTQTFTLPVNPPVTISNTSPLPPGTVGLIYSLQFIASGGVGGYTWTSSNIPSWLTLSPAGALSGTPLVSGSYPFNVQVTDSAFHSASGSFTVVVSAGAETPLTFTTASTLPPATTNLNFGTTFAASGGTGSYTFTASGQPFWLTLLPNGVLSGTPPTPGPVTFDVTVTDTGSHSATQAFTLPVNSTLAIVTASPLAPATLGVNTSYTLQATGGTGRYNWSAVCLPSWLSLDPSGILSTNGPAPSTGVYTFVLTVTDTANNTISKLFTLPVDSALTIVAPTVLPGATTDGPYAYTFTGAGGGGQYSWSATGLPGEVLLSAQGVLTSSSTPAGPITFTVTLSDAATSTQTSQTFTLPVTSTLTIGTTSPLPAATVGELYTANLSAFGGSGPYTWSANGLPSWLILTSTGFLTGTPPPGTTSVSFSAIVTDAATNTASLTVTLPVNPALPGVVPIVPHNGPPVDLPAATVGVPYAVLFCYSGATGLSTWSASPALPSWLSLPAGPSATDTLSGTPPAPGSILFTVTATENTVSTSETFVLPIDSSLAIANAPTPATLNAPYTFQFAATGGTGSNVWSASGLPSWLMLSSTGALSGTPPSLAPASFVVTVMDSAGDTVSIPVTLQVNPALAIVNISPLAAATAGNIYSLQFMATGGTGTYTWTGAQLPSWLTISSSGLLAGTPPSSGSVSFTITVTDTAGNMLSSTFTLPVNPSQGTTPLTISPATLPSATTGTLYSQQLTASGGSGNGYTFTGAQLPTWLTLSSAGLLTGTPTVPIAATFTVTATDSASNHTSVTYTVLVTQGQGVPILSITTTSPLPSATAGTLYSFQFAATGGTGGNTWTASGLPSTLTLSSGGLLTGTPTSAATILFSVTVTDSETDQATARFSLTVNPAQLSVLSITTSSPLPGATVGVPYSLALTATGGSGFFTWTGSGLPQWLILSSGGGLSGTPTASGTFTFTITAADSRSDNLSFASKTFALTVSPNVGPLQFTTVTLPGCTVNFPCSASIGASGGVPPYTFTLNQTQGIGDNLLLSPQGVVSGTPTDAGTLSFSVKVTDSANNSITRSFSIQVTGSTLTVTTSSLPAGTVNAAYSAALQATGGQGSYGWAVISGSLPPGLTLNESTGAITGTPTSSGTSTFTVQVTSGVLSSGGVQLSITIASLEPLTITSPLQLPVGDIGVAYSQTLAAIGGTGGYTWALTAGALPAGLMIASTGAITGTPTMAQTASFTATVTDSSGKTAAGAFSLTVNDPAVPSIITSSPLPDGVVNHPYDYSVNVTGGTAPYRWSIAEGTIPDGLTFDSSNGTLSGVPTTTGTFTFELTVTDSSGAAAVAAARIKAPSAYVSSTRSYTIHVVAVGAFQITTASPLPNATLNTPYMNVSLAASGGSAPYTWQLANGNWPPGISMDSMGNLSGTPAQSGTYSVIVQATDSTGAVATSAFSLTVVNPKAPAISISSSLADGTVGTAYSQGLSANGGTTPYSWSISAGALPPGLNINADTGAITGTPSQKGAFPFTVQVTDAAGVKATAQFTIGIVANDLQITTTSPLPNGSLNVPYSFGLSVTGGSAPYVWSLSAGSLVSGFSINPSTGVLSGTPTQAGSLHFIISVTDQSFDQTSQAFDLTVVSTMLTITTTQTSLTATEGAPFTTTFTAAQGNTPYTWSVVKGTLPPGITLNSQTGVLSGSPTTPGTYTFTVQVTDVTTAAAQVQVTFAVKALAFAITTTSPLSAGTAGDTYSTTFQSVGGTGAITWTAGSGTPPGLTLAPATGVLSGIPSMAGDFSFTVTAKDSTGAAVSQTYQLHIAGPGALMATASGLPATVNPGDQPTVNLTFTNPSTLPLTLTATLTLSPSLGGSSDLLFSNGLPSMQFTVPPGATQYSFSFQAGTVAGTIEVGLTFQAAGVDVTPTPAPSLSTQIAPAAPSIKSMVVTSISGGFQVVIDGLSTTRDMKTATFQFTPAAGATLQTNTVTVDVSAMFTAWYQSASSLPMGSQFSLTIPFTIGGNVNTIASVSATLTNSVGTSAPISATVP
jgi:hypothetical protein